MTRLTALIILLFVSVQLSAQFPSQKWYQGAVTLTDATIRNGQVKYDLERDVVQVNVDGLMETYSSKQVTSFTIQSIQKRRRKEKQQVFNRVFYSLPFANENGYKRMQFFEVIVEGTATLLAREYITTVTTNNGNRLARNRRFRGGAFNDPQMITRQVLAHRMFLASLDGTIKQLPSKRKDVVFMLKEHQANMKEFIKEEKLKLGELYGMSRAIQHFNILSAQQSKVY